MQVAEIEEVSALSPLQQEMLAHAVDRPGDDADVVQLCVALSGTLDVPALAAAWERMAARHSALRTSFRPWKLPAQLVQRRVTLPFAVVEAADDGEIAEFLEEDRARGFDPARGPLARLSVVRTVPGENLLVWTHHRLVLDSRSAALLVRQVLASYQEGTEPEGSRFREYVDWLRGQDAAEAERFWRRELAGLTAATAAAALGTPGPLAGAGGREERSVRLPSGVTAALRALSAERELSLETLIQGAWALLLSRRTGQNDVVFGITAAGRPAGLPAAEAMVGRFANTVPLRVTVAPKAPLLPWLRGLQDRRSALRPFEHVPLSHLREWSGLPPGAPLFQSRLVVESLSLEASGAGEIQWIEASPEPLTVFVRGGEELVLEVAWDGARFAEPEIAAWQEELRSLLEGFAADPRKRLSEFVTSGATAGTAGDEARRLDRIIQKVHRRDVAPGGRPARRSERKEPGGHEIVPVPRSQPLPATFYQEWALQLDGVERNSIGSALRVLGKFDVAALRRGLTEILRRHESLRTSFRWEQGEGDQGAAAYLVIAPPSAMPLPVVDLSRLPAERKAEVLRRLVADHAGAAFDMERGPLFLAQLVRLAPREHALLLNTHHLISDGWSVQVLQRELMSLYGAFSQGRPSPLAPLPIQLADFAHWQRRVFAGEALAAQLAWWRETLAELPPRPGLPIDLPRPEEPGSRAVNVAVKLAPRPAHVLRTLAQTTHCSLPMVLLAVVDALLHVYNGQEDLIVSLIFAARNRPELSGQIGLFMNTVPLRVDLSGNPTFRQLTERVRDATIEAYSHQDVPFPRLLQELFPGRKLTRTLLTGVCFNMLSFAEGAGAPGGGAGGPSLPGDITLQQIESEEAGTKHDLVFTSAESGGTVNFDLTGAADLFTPGRMRTIARDFEALLAEIANDPDVPLARLREKLTR